MLWGTINIANPWWIRPLATTRNMSDKLPSNLPGLCCEEGAQGERKFHIISLSPNLVEERVTGRILMKCIVPMKDLEKKLRNRQNSFHICKARPSLFSLIYLARTVEDVKRTSALSLNMVFAVAAFSSPITE